MRTPTDQQMRLRKAMGSKRIALAAAAELAIYAADEGKRIEYAFFMRVVGILIARDGLGRRCLPGIM